MALVAPNIAEVVLLRYMLNHTAATNVEMRLYNNNHTPVEADVLGSFTQASAAGYTAVSLPGVGWTVSTSLGTTTGETAERTFSFTTSATIYGYYVTDNAATGLLWSERLAA